MFLLIVDQRELFYIFDSRFQILLFNFDAVEMILTRFKEEWITKLGRFLVNRSVNTLALSLTFPIEH